MSHCWTIISDHVCDELAPEGTNSNAVGLVGPSTAKLTNVEIVNHPKRQLFHMLDDDGNLYYEGYSVGGDGFEPLDDFGMPNAGATSILYLNQKTGKMEEL